jgi:hypothetical protein
MPMMAELWGLSVLEDPEQAIDEQYSDGRYVQIIETLQK